jgi:hypothetical protein
MMTLANMRPPAREVALRQVPGSHLRVHSLALRLAGRIEALACPLQQ